MTLRRFILVAPEPSETSPPNPGGMMTASVGLKSYANEQGIELFYLDTTQSSFPVPSLLSRTHKSVRRVIRLFWLAATKKPDGLIMFSSGGLAYFERGFMARIAQLFRVPNILYLRSGHILPLFAKPGLKRRISQYFLHGSEFLGVQGANWLPFIESVGGPLDRVRVIPNWLEPETKLRDTPLTHNPGAPVRFCFTGWMVQAKGVTELIDAATQLHAAGKNFKLTLMGGGTLLDQLQAQVEERGLGDCVTLTGWMDPAMVGPVLEKMDVFVLPTYAEGFPNALMEAMSKGLPAISTPVGGIPDSLLDGQNGFLIAPRDSVALASAMQRYIDDPALISTHSEATLKIVRDRHDYRRNCAELFGLFDTPR